MNEIKKAISKILDWDLRYFDIMRCGTKNGRPNWEVYHYQLKVYYAFTAFDENDIHDLHKVVC